jgi:DNA-directed RNA polymerase specialized sigma24 family protein
VAAVRRPATQAGRQGGTGPIAGSPPPFERVVELHGPDVLRFCAARVGADRAEDCFQETMLSALRAYESLREAGAIRSWLPPPTSWTARRLAADRSISRSDAR